MRRDTPRSKSIKTQVSRLWHSNSEQLLYCLPAELTSLLIMSYNCFSGNMSSHSLGGQPQTSCGSSCPSNLVYISKPQSASTCQLSSPLSGGCMEASCEPASCQASYVMPSACQTSCYQPRTSTLCQAPYTGSRGFGSSSCCSQGFGSRSSCSLGCGSRSFYSSGCGSSGFRPLSYGAHGCSSLGYGSGTFRPTYLASGSCQSPCYRPTYASSYCRPSCY